LPADLSPEPRLEQLRSRIGLATTPLTAVVDAERVRAWVEAIEDPDPLWREQVPPTFLVSVRSAAWSELLGEIDASGRQWLNGGDRFDYARPLRVGERITMTARVVDCYEKPGRSGDLLFVVTEASFSDEQGEPVCRILGTSILR
jgi:hypothetical protein